MNEDATDDMLMQMLRFGDRNEKYDGAEVDLEDYMYIMKTARLF